MQLPNMSKNSAAHQKKTKVTGNTVSLSKCFVILEGILSLEGILRNAPAFFRGVFSHPQNASETVTCGDGWDKKHC